MHIAMKKIILSTALAMTSWLAAEAVSVAVAPGELHSAVTGNAVTELTVTGSLDVRDFAFIADNLTELSALNLSGATVVAYTCTGSECYFGSRGRFEADELPRYAFFGSKLRSLSLPAGLRVVGEASVAACEELEAITLPAGVREIGDHAFSASGLKSVVLNSREIGEGAFAGCAALASVEIGTGVIEIGDRAFAGCEALAIVEVADGSALQEIGDEAFSGTALTSFDFALCPNVEQVGEWAFAGTPIARVALPGSLAEVPEGVFFGNASAQSVVLPEYAEEVGDYAFYGNTIAGNELVIPDKVAYIGDNAFEGARPASVKAYPPAVPELGKETFRGMNDDFRTPLYVTKDMIAAYKAADQWCDFDIKDISAIDAPMVGAEVAVRIGRIGSKLQIVATDNIDRANLYDEAGALCDTARGTGCEATLNVAAINSPVVIVEVRLHNGITRTFKLMAVK